MSTEIFGAETLNPFTGLNRDSFPDEDSYLSEAIRRQMLYDSKEYQQARAKVLRLHREKLQEQEQARQTAEFNRALERCTLPRQTQEALKAEAAQKAASDYSSGRIAAGAIEKKSKEYFVELERRAKINFVSNQRMNAAIRAKLQQ